MLDRAFAPRWAGGWALTRVWFGLAALEAQVVRARHVADALAVPELTFASGPTRLADHVLLSPAAAWGLWGLGFVGLGGLLVGGRWAKPGLLAWFLTYAALLAGLGLNVRAPERLLAWIVAGLLLGPIGERGLTAKWRSPAARWYFLVVYGALYGSTGFLKLHVESAWWTGEALRYDLLDRWHAGGALAVWLSGQPLLCALASWYTMLFEAGFPLLVGVPAAHPWLLLAGAGMHGGIGVLMDVGTLGTMAVSIYPVLCDPDVARRLWERGGAAWAAWRGGAG